MFYIKLKDGRTITSDLTTDDVEVFHNLIERELGDQAAELFDTLIFAARATDNVILSNYKKCISGLNRELNKSEPDKSKIDEYMSELKDIYIDLS